MSEIIEIENLTKDYQVGFFTKKKVRALDGLSLTVRRGEVFGFLGANGAGKTTTLKLLMRLIYPSAGRAKILGRDISDITMHNRIGYLPENPYFYDYLTARELVGYFGRLFGLNNEEQKDRTEKLLTRVGLEEKSWNKQLRKFSKGMLQRVGLAQALVNDPEVIFLDEPMSGLDPIGRKQVRDLILELKSQGKTVFMCSHILSDIEVLCDRVAILRNGKLGASGKLNDLLKQSGKTQSVEIVVSGVDQADIEKAIETERACTVASSPAGVKITVYSENEVDAVLAMIRKLDGSFVSAQPVKQSLEELFVAETM
jgi:ABC-2 type transport system ATP-binding protein